MQLDRVYPSTLLDRLREAVAQEAMVAMAMATAATVAVAAAAAVVQGVLCVCHRVFGCDHRSVLARPPVRLAAVSSSRAAAECLFRTRCPSVR